MEIGQGKPIGDIPSTNRATQLTGVVPSESLPAAREYYEDTLQKCQHFLWLHQMLGAVLLFSVCTVVCSSTSQAQMNL